MCACEGYIKRDDGMCVYAASRMLCVKHTHQQHSICICMCMCVEFKLLHSGRSESATGRVRCGGVAAHRRIYILYTIQSRARRITRARSWATRSTRYTRERRASDLVPNTLGATECSTTTTAAVAAATDVRYIYMRSLAVG